MFRKYSNFYAMSFISLCLNAAKGITLANRLLFSCDRLFLKLNIRFQLVNSLTMLELMSFVQILRVL